MSDEVSTDPAVIDRADQAYVGIGATVTMAGLAEVAHRIPEVMSWLAARNLTPAGAPFFRYNVIDMHGEFEVEVGVPVASAPAMVSAPVAGSPVTESPEVHAGVLPAGRYATVTHVGPPNTLLAATRDLLAWAEQHDLTWDMVAIGSEERWGCRIESYLTDPRSEPDTEKWQTVLALRLAD